MWSSSQSLVSLGRQKLNNIGDDNYRAKLQCEMLDLTLFTDFPEDLTLKPTPEGTEEGGLRSRGGKP
jgi:hypothetical protein